MNFTAAAFAVIVTLYYWWQNIKGIEESSDKALEVMKITTVMVVILLGWGIFSAIPRGRQAAAFAHALESAFQPRCAGLSEVHSLPATWVCSASSWPSATPFWP